MPIPNPLKAINSRLSRAASQLPDRSILMDRRSAAEAAVSDAEQRHQSAALSTEINEPGAAARLVEATEALSLARDKLRTVMAAQLEADAIHSEHGRKARADAMAQEDAVAAQAWDDVAKAAKLVEPAVLAQRDAVARLGKAYQHALAVSVHNRRVRQDLIRQSVNDEVVKEITRLSPIGAPLPGANMLTMLNGTTDITPIAVYFAGIAAAIKSGLNAR